MSKTWYPVINYENCIECGACVEHCTHGVYNKDKAPRPVVVYPEGCVQGCTGCANKCPVDAITYFGQKGDEKESGCCSGNSGCGCSDDTSCDCNSEQEESKDSGCGCGGGCCG